MQHHRYSMSLLHATKGAKLIENNVENVAFSA